MPKNKISRRVNMRTKKKMKKIKKLNIIDSNNDKKIKLKDELVKYTVSLGKMFHKPQFHEPIILKTYCYKCCDLSDVKFKYCPEGLENIISNFINIEIEKYKDSIEFDNEKLLVSTDMLRRFQTYVSVTYFNFNLNEIKDLLIFILMKTIYKLRKLHLDFKNNPYSKIINKSKEPINLSKHKYCNEIINLIGASLYLMFYIRNYFNHVCRDILGRNDNIIRFSVMRLFNMINVVLKDCVDSVGLFMNNIIIEERKISSGFFPYTKNLVIGMSIIYEITIVNDITKSDLKIPSDFDFDFRI